MSFYTDTNSKDFSSMKMWLQKFWDLKISPLFEKHNERITELENTMDARGEIKNLPKNYLSKESAENMLNAMVSAGVIASYTMTYDAANSRYQFVIVKPQEEIPTNEVNNEENI